MDTPWTIYGSARYWHDTVMNTIAMQGRHHGHPMATHGDIMAAHRHHGHVMAISWPPTGIIASSCLYCHRMATAYRGIAILAGVNDVGCHGMVVVTHGDTMAAHENPMAMPCTPHKNVIAISRGAHGVAVGCLGIAMISPLAAMALPWPGNVTATHGNTPWNYMDSATDSRGNAVRMPSHCRGIP